MLINPLGYFCLLPEYFCIFLTSHLYHQESAKHFVAYCMLIFIIDNRFQVCPKTGPIVLDHSHSLPNQLYLWVASILVSMETLQHSDSVEIICYWDRLCLDTKYRILYYKSMCIADPFYLPYIRQQLSSCSVAQKNKLGRAELTQAEAVSLILFPFDFSH